MQVHTTPPDVNKLATVCLGPQHAVEHPADAPDERELVHSAADSPRVSCIVDRSASEEFLEELMDQRITLWYVPRQSYHLSARLDV
jgi:hypothetical protein